MKKMLKKSGPALLLILCMTFMTFTDGSEQDANQLNKSEAKIDIPINFGTKGCVCKGTTCQDQGWVSFREYCGYGDGTDSTCGIVTQGQCDDND